MSRLCLSLFDYSGVWSDPWRRTHTVVTVDIQHGGDVLDIRPQDFAPDVVLAAPPCTAFTKTAAQHWPKQDASGVTELGVACVRHTLDLVKAWRPRVFALENPPGRMPRLVPGLSEFARWRFDPWQYSGWAPHPRALVHGWLDPERARKHTVIWGNSRRPEERPEEPQQGLGRHTVTSWIGPGPQRSNMRSRTPFGFALAFYVANVEGGGTWQS